MALGVTTLYIRDTTTNQTLPLKVGPSTLAECERDPFVLIYSVAKLFGKTEDEVWKVDKESVTFIDENNCFEAILSDRERQRRLPTAIVDALVERAKSDGYKIVKTNLTECQPTETRPGGFLSHPTIFTSRNMYTLSRNARLESTIKFVEQ